METLNIIRHILLAALVVSCAYTDLAKGKIYNAVTFPAIFLGLLTVYTMGGVYENGVIGISLVSSLAAMGIVMLLFIWPYIRGGIAAGDVKLMLAVGAIGGLYNYFTVYALLYSTLIGAFMAVLLFIWKGRFIEGVKSTAKFAVTTGRVDNDGDDDAEGKNTTGLTIPYGSAIAAGTMIAWFVLEVRTAV